MEPPADNQHVHGRPFSTALGVAAVEGNEPAARLLIEHGADVNARQSGTILASAIRGHNLKLIDLLLSKGAHPDEVAFGDDDTPLMLVVLYNDVEQRKKGGAALDSEANWAAIARRLVAGGANVNYMDCVCRSAYTEARDRRSAAMMNLLTTLGADITQDIACRPQPVH